MTPNFVSNVNTSVALSCTCRGSGNLQEECEQLEESFSHNPCLSECVPPAPSPRGSVSWIQGEEKGQLCGPPCFHPSPAPSSAWVYIPPSLGLSSFSYSLSDPPPQAASSTCFGRSPTQGISKQNETIAHSHLPCYMPGSLKHSLTFHGSLRNLYHLPASILPSFLSSVEAIAAKMHFHSQLFSQDWADSTFSVIERQVGPPLLHTSYLCWTSWGKPREGDRGGDLTVVLNTIDL